ncbi:MAG TPA: hypothetical protein VGE04_01140 [Chloroflexia bacterium]
MPLVPPLARLGPNFHGTNIPVEDYAARLREYPGRGSWTLRSLLWALRA